MKFAVGDLVVVVGGTEDHYIPIGTICEVIFAEDGFEFPYELKDVETGEYYGDNMVAEDEIEFASEGA